MEIIVEFFTLLLNVLVEWLKALVHLVIPRERADLSGQVIVLTGSAQGLGKEMALLLHRLGARLALVDINQTLNEELVAHLKASKSGSDVVAYRCDLADRTEVENVTMQILMDFDHVDILINNAGIVKCAPLIELEWPDIERTFTVNVFAHFWLIKQLLPSMIERKTGHIVAISSIAGLMGTANLVDYTASKHAVNGMMDALDCELRAQGHHDYIKLTTVCPLAIATGMFRRPKTRFNGLLPILAPQPTAAKIVDLIRQNRPSSVTTIPCWVFYFAWFDKVLPKEVSRLVQRFLSYEVGQH